MVGRRSGCSLLLFFACSAVDWQVVTSFSLATTTVPREAAAPVAASSVRRHPAFPTATTTESTHRIINNKEERLRQELEQEQLLARYQSAAQRVLQSFQPTAFAPKITNPHVQTIASVFLRPNPAACWIPDHVSVPRHLLQNWVSLWETVRQHDEGDSRGFWHVRQRIHTPDDDFFHVDYKYSSYSDDDDDSDGDVVATTAAGAAPSSQGLVVMVHGLQTSSNSSLCKDLATAYNAVGLDVACVHFRGCSGEPNDSLRAYHLGFTDDLKYYLQQLAQSPALRGLPIYLTGFSLGANVVVRALGELGTAAFEKYNIYGAAVNALPLDNAKNHAMLVQPGVNSAVYNAKLTASLKSTSLGQLDRFPDSPEAARIDRHAVEQAQQVADVELAVICPIFGFADCLDYYYQTSCLRTIHNVAVPVFCLQSLDDPFFDPTTPLPNDQTEAPAVRFHATAHGGHCGYLFQTKPTTTTTTSSSTSDGSSNDNHDRNDNNDDVSFVGWQLAQFIQHVHQSRRQMDRCKHSYFWQTSGFSG